MHKRQITKLLEEAGFVLVRENKHQIWEKSGYRILLSQGAAPIPYRLVKRILVDIERAKKGMPQLFANQIVAGASS